MNGLMFGCMNWGGMDCHPDVSAHKRLKELKNGMDITSYPGGDDLRQLDEICKSCELRFFEIKQRECLVCGGLEFTETLGLEINDGGAKKFENFYLKCKKCETPAILIKSN
jgi:hypothetical protein